MGKENLIKVLPNDTELEEVVLGAMLLERDAVLDIVDIINSQSFYDKRNGLIFQSIRNLFDKSQPIDILTVVNDLRSSGVLNDAGGPVHVAEVTKRVNSAQNILSHARIIAELSMKRELIKISGKTIDMAFDPTNDVFELIGDVDSSINSIVESNTKGVFVSFKQSLHDNVVKMSEATEQDLTGVPSGFVDLDRITGGWQNTDLIILAARPGMGKTAFVVSTMINTAKMFKKSVAMFSLEMSTEQLMRRVISSECEIELDLVRKPSRIKDYQWNTITHKTSNIEDLPIFIDDTPGLSMIELRAKASRLKRKHGINLIIVDYLQLMSGDSKGNREQEIASISRGLKLVAKELNVPIIALSQLSRAVESRGGDKRPMLSDLRESGAIEQDADMVGFIYRPEYYGIMEAEDGTYLGGKGEIIIAKNRNGSLDSVYLKFIGRFTKWADDEIFDISEKIPEPEKFPTNGNAKEFDAEKAWEEIEKSDSRF